MIIEVASTETLKRDRYERYNLYNKRCKGYWIVDISNKTIEIFSLNDANKNTSSIAFLDKQSC
jgi:Uma2 family endonuclease